MDEFEQDGAYVDQTAILDDDRCYNLFGVLAGVRSEGPPIADPKGMPPDASAEVKQQCAQWDGDGHNHSWLTLDELNSYDWDQLRTNSSALQWWNKTRPHLTALSHIAGDQPIRIVFWFDN